MKPQKQNNLKINDMEPLFKSIDEKKLSKVKDLIEDGVDINQKDKSGYSALHIAIANRLEEIYLYLVNNGIDVNAQDKNGQTALHYSAVYNLPELAKSILQNGGDLAIEDIYGNQPLWTAVFNDKGRNDRVELIKLFIENGANIHHKNKVDKSPYDIVTIANYNNLKPIMGIN